LFDWNNYQYQPIEQSLLSYLEHIYNNYHYQPIEQYPLSYLEHIYDNYQYHPIEQPLLSYYRREGVVRLVDSGNYCNVFLIGERGLFDWLIVVTVVMSSK
jgi:hypothetical protein